jgi:hypothetical protein
MGEKVGGPCTFGSGREGGLPMMSKKLSRVSQEEIYTSLINGENKFLKSREVGYDLTTFPKEKSNTGRFEFVRFPTYVKIVYKAEEEPPAAATPPAFMPQRATEPVVQIRPEATLEAAPPPTLAPGAAAPVGSRVEPAPPPLAKQPPRPGASEEILRNRLGKSGQVDRLVLDHSQDAEPVLESALGAPKKRQVHRPPTPGQTTERDKMMRSSSAPQLPKLATDQLGLLGSSMDPRREFFDPGVSPRPEAKSTPALGPKKFRGVGMPKRENAGSVPVPRHLVDQVEIQQLSRHWPEFKPDRSTKLNRKHPPTWHPMMTVGTR